MEPSAKTERLRPTVKRSSAGTRSRAMAAGAVLGIVSLPAAATTATAGAAGPLVIEGERHVEIVAQPQQVPAIIEAARALAAGAADAPPVLVTIPWRG